LAEKCGEIDILEYVGENQILFTSLHRTVMEIQSTQKTRIEDIEGYHIYAMDWSKDKIDFLLIIISVHFQSRE
jgi:beta-glucanase (GH16 family)